MQKTRSAPDLISRFAKGSALLGSALIAFAGALPPARAADSASLTLKIERVTPRGGRIKAALYNSDTWPGRHGIAVLNWLVDATPGETIISTAAIAPGRYAIKVMQDEDGNGKMDFNWFGMPTEPYGFSNDAKPGLDQPSFDKAAIVLKPGPNTLIIHLRNI